MKIGHRVHASTDGACGQRLAGGPRAHGRRGEEPGRVLGLHPLRPGNPRCPVLRSSPPSPARCCWVPAPRSPSPRAQDRAQGRHGEPAGEQNPLLREARCLGAPDYAAVELELFGPAFERAMQDHAAEIAVIADNGEPPSFANTIVALERSGVTSRARATCSSA